MRNIEIKARVMDIKDAERIAARIAGDVSPTRLSQIDTYFNVPGGRLKLRELKGEETASELIFYMRPNRSSPKHCDYQIVEAKDPSALLELLSSALGIRAVVIKERTVYLFRNVRIHLDSVEGLGPFIELEAVLSDDHSEMDSEHLVEQLMCEFSISEEDLMGGSYCELMERKHGRSGAP